MSLICIDTHIAIWGIKEQSQPDQQEMIPKTKAFLQYVDEKGVRILMPTVVVSELLMAIEPGLHAAFCNLLARGFLIAPFDMQAAALAAHIWQASQSNGVIDNLKQNHNAPREWLKADCMIIATAVSQGALRIYSHDDYLRRLAQPFIEVREIPTILSQLELELPGV